jgi:hypothetical protein
MMHALILVCSLALAPAECIGSNADRRGSPAFRDALVRRKLHEEARREPGNEVRDWSGVANNFQCFMSAAEIALLPRFAPNSNEFLKIKYLRGAGEL